MTKRQRKKPTDAELEILRVLWERGPSTVREVFQTLQQTRDTGYTTVLKLMQIMTDKGLVQRDKAVRPQIYEAIYSQGQTQRQLLGDLLDRAFSGSPGKLVLQALSEKQTTAEERRAIRRLLDQLEGEAT
jgi:predicted transcriptional regulator